MLFVGQPGKLRPIVNRPAAVTNRRAGCQLAPHSGNPQAGTERPDESGRGSLRGCATVRGGRMTKTDREGRAHDGGRPAFRPAGKLKHAPPKAAVADRLAGGSACPTKEESMPHLRHRFRTGQEACPSVFGNGTGFVWHGGGTQEKDVVKRALIVEMKAGLVTVHEAEGGLFGEILEGDGQRC